jgi:hypothetical protein
MLRNLMLTSLMGDLQNSEFHQGIPLDFGQGCELTKPRRHREQFASSVVMCLK